MSAPAEQGAWIFPSHSTKDFPLVRRVRGALEDPGHARASERVPWEGSAESPSYEARPESFARRELAHAMRIAEDRPSKRPWIVHGLLDRPPNASLAHLDRVLEGRDASWPPAPGRGDPGQGVPQAVAPVAGIAA